MFGGQLFYYGIIKKMVVVFGSVFADISINRINSANNETALINVPIAYAPKNKMLEQIQQDPELSRPYSVLLPRLSFEITSITPDSGRRIPPMNKRAKQITGDPNNFNVQYTPAPYNINFALYVYSKNADDGFKIIEQIFPMFTPDWTPQVQLVPEMNETRDISFVLDNVSLEDTYAGDVKERRILIHTLNFTCKTFFYGPIIKKPIIKFVDIRVDVGDPATANTLSAAGADETITLQPGLLSNGSPTTNAAASVSYLNINVSDNWGYAFTKSIIR